MADGVARWSRARALIDEAVVAHVDNQRAMLAALSAAEQAQLARLLDQLLAGLERTVDGNDGNDGD
ncbi:hypothetical protein LGM14_19635 [Burkholderia multivorans]|nr:hypothetical protein [Burkholderia multivorans]MDN7594921.1 hypothetical protein [Burkholderia multivorans]